MTVFVLVALLLALLAIAAVVVPLWRRHSADRPDAAADLDVYRERAAELEREHARGNIGSDELDEAREELERELLAVAPATYESRATAPVARPMWTLLATALVIPAVAVSTYLATGRPDLIADESQAGLSPQQIERFRQMVPAQRIKELEPLVERRPEARRAWILLAQAYRGVGRYGDAVNAYARIQALGEPDPWLLARQAEALLLANERRFSSSIERLVQRALELDRSNPLALMLAGHAALANGEDAQAVTYWQRLASNMPADSDNRAMVERLIARAKDEAPNAGNADTATTGSAEEPAQAATSATTDDTGDTAAGDSAARVAVRVSLAPSLTDSVSGDTTVFVFARNAGGGNGRSAPLAVRRMTVDRLPSAITLTEADAMTPNSSLAQAERVRVTARVSLQGGVMPQSGDLQGESEVIEVGADETATVTIDRRIP